MVQNPNPVRELVRNVLLHEFGAYGRDAQGNIIISEDSIEAIAYTTTDIIHASLVRPVVTVTHTDLMRLAESAGFRHLEFVQDGVQHHTLSLRDGTVELFTEVERLVDQTVKFVLEQVGKGTAPRK